MDKETIHFRIIELDGHQIMLERDHLDNEKMPEYKFGLSMIIHYGGTRNACYLGFASKEERDRQFLATPDSPTYKKKDHMDEEVEVHPFDLFRQTLTFAKRVIAGV